MKRRLPEDAFWRGKRVFITGHTGFKGGWLSLWLNSLGAKLSGYALAPETGPNFFSLCHIENILEHNLGDVRDAVHLSDALAASQPDIIIHLAAQPLVRASYLQPLETYATNIIGTANILQAAEKAATVRAILIITSDKVYAESVNRHKESDRLGGYDPYSASKACAELVTASFPCRAGKFIATLRSGNVIGGGDWSPDRLVADLMKSLLQNRTPVIRNPHSIRPWQHVLDPVCGYLLAAEYLWANQPNSVLNWNFGPETESEAAVQEIAQRLCALWGDAIFETHATAEALHEAEILRLDSTKARTQLGWCPAWNLQLALTATADWFRKYQAGENMKDFSMRQIAAYQEQI